jgi:hypothetical protein
MWHRLRVRRLPHSLKRDIAAPARTPARRFTNVDDVTQDQPNPRALRASGFSVFAGAAFHLATTAATGVSSARFAALGRMGA